MKMQKRIFSILIIIVSISLLFCNTVYAGGTTIYGENLYRQTYNYESYFNSYPTLSYGSKGAKVMELQENINLIMAEIANSPWTPLVVDGDFGNKTYNAVLRIQRYEDVIVRWYGEDYYHKLLAVDADGIVGPITWGKILTIYALLYCE